MMDCGFQMLDCDMECDFFLSKSEWGQHRPDDRLWFTDYEWFWPTRCWIADFRLWIVNDVVYLSKSELEPEATSLYSDLNLAENKRLTSIWDRQDLAAPIQHSRIPNDSSPHAVLLNVGQLYLFRVFECISHSWCSDLNLAENKRLTSIWDRQDLAAPIQVLEYQIASSPSAVLLKVGQLYLFRALECISHSLVKRKRHISIWDRQDFAAPMHWIWM